MPSVAHPGNRNNVQWLWILYIPEIYCWTLIYTAQRSPSINKPPSQYNQSSGLSDPSFHTMSSRCSVVALSTQWKPKSYKTFHKNTTKTFNKSFHKLSGNWKCMMTIICSKSKTISNELSKWNVFSKYMYKES